MLEAARLHTVNRFIFSSSAAVYGNTQERCAEELPAHPCSSYGYSKLIGELLCKQYNELYTIRTVSLRYFNVYGPRQHPDSGVLAVLERNLIQNKPITIFGDGNQTRDFVPVKKVVHANIIAGVLADKLPGSFFNVATGESSSLNEQFSKLLEKYPTYANQITFEPARPGDIRHSQADCSKLKNAVRLYYHNMTL